MRGVAENLSIWNQGSTRDLILYILCIRDTSQLAEDGGPNLSFLCRASALLVEWVGFRHRITMISSSFRIFQLSFQGPPLFGYYPDVLRVSVLLALADQSFRDSLSEQSCRFRSGEDSHGVAQRLVSARLRRWHQAEIPWIPLVLGVAAVVDEVGKRLQVIGL